jgi:hypothetical protein
MTLTAAGPANPNDLQPGTPEGRDRRFANPQITVSWRANRRAA